MAASKRATLTLALSVGGVVVIAFVGMGATDMSVSISSAIPLIFLLCMQFCAAVYCRIRRITRLQPAAETIVFFVIASFGLLPISYLVLRFNLPLADDWLMAMDKAMWFDWVAFVRAVDGQPTLAALLTIAYSSLGMQLFFLPAFLSFLGDNNRGYATVFAYILIVIASCFISIWFPSKGAFFVHGVDQSMLQNVNAHFGYAFLTEFDSVRANGHFQLSFDRIQGLLTFPSVHVAAAVLCIWAAWGSRLLAIPFLLLNACMIMSAITNGGHYLVDVLAGILVGCIAIVIAVGMIPGTSLRASRRAEHRLLTEIRSTVLSQVRTVVGQGPLRSSK